MVERDIIVINKEKCNGCGNCIPGCPEGALQVIDGKAVLISDLFCDGLGACVGHCPTGAMKVEKREASPYDEKKTMENIVKHGENTTKAHLMHLKDHGEEELLAQAIEYLEENDMNVPDLEEGKMPCGCPGSAMREFGNDEEEEKEEGGKRNSTLRQWPVHLHLVPPNAPFFNKKDVVLSADCAAYALADFHKDHLKGKGVAIACPKLDDGQDTYLEKLKEMFTNANSITVMTMEVPCCNSLLTLAEKAKEEAKVKTPLKSIVVSVEGKVLSEEWV